MPRLLWDSNTDVEIEGDYHSKRLKVVTTPVQYVYSSNCVAADLAAPCQSGRTT